MKRRSCASSDQSPARSATHPAAPVAFSRRSSSLSRDFWANASACRLRAAAPLLRLPLRRRVVAPADCWVFVAIYPLLLSGATRRATEHALSHAAHEDHEDHDQQREGA